MIHKLLITIVLLVFAGTAPAQESGASTPPSPGERLDAARAYVEAGDTGAAVGELEALAEAGFTAVAVITGDEILASLAGDPAYDSLVAAMTKKAYPCEHDERFRRFDFWVGTWDVHVPDGRLAGHNRIEKSQRGCVLIERWEGVRGSTGMSINYFDAARSEWVQVWNDASGNQIDIRGGMTDDGMRLSGRIHYVASGRTADFRGLWTPLDDGRVRQFFEQSDDDGATWTPWFEGIYTRTQATP